MGENTLTARSDGEKIPASDHNELVQAMQIDLVPRNNSRVPQDIIGQLGTSIFRWLRAYIKEIFIGTAANNLKIYEGAAGEFWIENGLKDRVKIKDGAVEMHTNGVKRFDVTDSGVNWATIPNGDIPQDKVNGIVFKNHTTSTFTASATSGLLRYTTTADSMVFFVSTTNGFTSASEGLYYLVGISKHYIHVGASTSTETISGGAFLPSGTALYTNGSTVVGTIHIFGL